MHTPHFDAASGCVRFWVPIAGIAVGASVSRLALQARYAPALECDDPLATFLHHASDLDAAVRRRVAGGAIELVVIEAADLRPA